MKNTILPLILLSLLAAPMHAAVAMPETVPDGGTTGLLLGIAVIGGLAVKRFFARR